MDTQPDKAIEMSAEVSAVTARQILAARIKRFLAGLERFERSPNRREAYHVLDALACIHEGRIADGEEAMLLAERGAPLPEFVAVLPGIHEKMTIVELRSRLNAIFGFRE